MDRRTFVKGCLSAITLGVVPKELAATPSPAAKELRLSLEVVHAHCFAELQSRYLDDPEAGVCPLFSCGATAEITIGGFADCPDSFCPKAYAAMQAALATAPVGSIPAIVSCGSATRPVVFKICRRAGS